MDTQNLQAFVHVAETNSFSLAAERLFITQPAVSKRISALEEQLDTRLFDRINRSVRLTEAGRVLLPRALDILQTVKTARQQLADLSGEVSGPLRLATSHHVGLHRLPSLLRQYSVDFPKVELDMTFLGSEKAYTEILQGHCELAIVTLAPELAPHRDSNIKSISVWNDPLVFVASPSHPLSQQEQVSLKDLSQSPAILPELTTHTTFIVKKLFDEKNLPLELKMATNFLETLKMMVSINLGWSLLPKTLLDDDIKVLNVTGVKLSRELGVIYHRNRSLSNAAQAFIRSLNLKIDI
ncbi:MAG: LysR family transcriptional regulator [Cellvibrionaceae bacterium]